ncbi:hypothetical protein DOTSEDRAFT_73783 [Dothistroma septosporum NZE10]|uniref:Gfo/Idh/MocA-like oxidoreductase N-terminal domain-containing protein n=1 Tax=Dothistroma septosporum (strain NZE10 / CBS 128990) TaxID=675120 RepID=N1PH68_DOTSN|nr:hypothetical protein DOTSEDRAFT_73783 [Dothistroma septosporum NZE10]
MIQPASISIAIVGSGLIGPRHAESVMGCAEATLLCLVDPRPDAVSVAEAFGVPIFGSIQVMFEQGVVPDAAIVCTPNDTHVSVSQDLLRAGVHVLVEKPISTDLESGRQLLRAAQAAERQLLVGHHRRFNPYVTATKRALVSNAIGTPIAVSGLWTTFKPVSYFEPPTEWRAMSGTGGPILINLIHDVDLLQYLMGPIARVHAEPTLSQRRHAVEEGAAVLLRFASGVVGTFILSDATPSVHSFESGTGENPMIAQTGKDFYRIFGSEGTLSVGDMKLSTYGSTEKSWSNSPQGEQILVGSEVPFDEQVLNFTRVVKGLERPRCTGQDGLQALLVCDAVKRSIDTGMPVDIEM